MARTQHTVDATNSKRHYSRFDLLLVAIPLALVAGLGSVVFLPIPQFVGVSLGAAAAGCLVAYGVYSIAQSVCATPDHESNSYTL